MTSLVVDCKNALELERVLETSELDILLESQSEALAFVQLCRERCFKLSTLSTHSLARIVSALYPHVSNQQVAKFVQGCLCAKTAEDCSTLKVEVDQLVSLYDLLHNAVGSKNVRHDILSHFDAQAQRVKASKPFALPLKLISYVGACAVGCCYAASLARSTDPERFEGASKAQSTRRGPIRATPSTPSTPARVSLLSRCSTPSQATKEKSQSSILRQKRRAIATELRIIASSFSWTTPRL